MDDKLPDRLFIRQKDLIDNAALCWDRVRHWSSDIEYVRVDLAEKTSQPDVQADSCKPGEHSYQDQPTCVHCGAIPDNY